MPRTWERDPKAPGLFKVTNEKGQERYFYDFEFKGQRYSAAAGDDLEDARSELYQKRVEARRGAAGVQSNHYGLGRLVKQYLVHAKRRTGAKAFKRYELALTTVLRYITVDYVSQVSPALIEDYVAYRESGGVSNRTLNIETDTFHRVFKYGVDMKRIAEDPLKRMKRLPEGKKYQRPKRPLDREEFEKLLDHKHPVGNCKSALHPGLGCRCRELWLMLGETGMRLGEVVELRWSEVDFKRLCVHVAQGKTKASVRWIPMTNRVAEMLGRRLWRAGLKGKLRGGWVFITKTGKQIHYNNNRKLRRCLDGAGIDKHGVDVHSMRRTFASLLIQSGVNLKVVQTLLGHATSRMTMDVYAAVLPGDDLLAIKQLDEWSKGAAGLGGRSLASQLAPNSFVRQVG